MARRAEANPALQYAAEQASRIGDGLWVLEALRADHPYASDRFHTWVVDGMKDTAASLARHHIPYHPHVEVAAGGGKGLLRAAATGAALVVTDDHPGFFIPRMLKAVAQTDLGCPVHAVDGHSIVPLGIIEDRVKTAAAFRRRLQQRLLDHLWMPLSDSGLHSAGPGEPPQAVHDRWPSTDLARFDPADYPIDHDVPAVAAQGGHGAAVRRLERFVDQRHHYGEARHPDEEATSGLSPYLHFGHVGVHEVVQAVLAAEAWDPGKIRPDLAGRRRGWWGLPDPIEAFLDQVVTWRSLGAVDQYQRPDNTSYGSLPQWARATLEEHDADRGPAPYTRDQLEAAATEDPVWNAAQRQLRTEGVIHNYLRMLWGKRILGWAPDAKTAVEWMFYLNDRWALDGRDPNSISGIMWCLGRFDRAWGPERPIYGKVRYMSSENTVRKLRMKSYLDRFGPPTD